VAASTHVRAVQAAHKWDFSYSRLSQGCAELEQIGSRFILRKYQPGITHAPPCRCPRLRAAEGKSFPGANRLLRKRYGNHLVLGRSGDRYTSRQFTSELVYGKTVTVIEHGIDKYGRTLGEVLLPDRASLNQTLVQAGLAWHYVKYSKDHVLANLESRPD
jgi:nuclease-like protein